MDGISAEELEARVREILNYGSLTYSGHVKERMVERNYEIADVKHILKYGKVLNFSMEGNERYRCEIHGEDLEGCKGAVITIVIKNKKLIIVTVLGGM